MRFLIDITQPFGLGRWRPRAERVVSHEQKRRATKKFSHGWLAHGPPYLEEELYNPPTMFGPIKSRLELPLNHHSTHSLHQDYYSFQSSSKNISKSTIKMAPVVTLDFASETPISRTVQYKKVNF